MVATLELPPALRQGVERARAQLDDSRIKDLLVEAATIPSPTGEASTLARYFVERLARVGLDAELDVVARDQANTVARYGRHHDGPSLLLYAAIDTPFSGRRDEDEAYLGPNPRVDFALPPRVKDNKVIGLGAENPKAFAAAAVAAAEALAMAGVELRGELVVVLASGSMPIYSRPGFDREPLGFGSGIRHVLEHRPKPDFAIVLKPGYAVAHEEVGLAWFRVIVRGQLTYTGIRHKGSYRNPVVDAARVVAHIETWFAGYADRHADGLVAPQGSLNAIRAGSPDRVAFVPSSCEIDLDVRISPRTTPEEVEAELRAALRELEEASPGLDLELERRIALPGTMTDPDNWIVRSLIRAWEDREGRPHAPLIRQSGATDGAVLRSYGIPTARIGLPAPATPTPVGGFSMGVADPATVRRLAEVLVYTIVDTTARTRAEVGLERGH